MDRSVPCGPLGGLTHSEEAVWTLVSAETRNQKPDPAVVLGRGAKVQGCSALLCLGLHQGSVHAGLQRGFPWKAISNVIGFPPAHER